MEWLTDSITWADCPAAIRNLWEEQTRDARERYEATLHRYVQAYDTTPGMPRRRAEIQVEEIGIIYLEDVRELRADLALSERRWWVRLDSTYVLTATDLLGWDSPQPEPERARCPLSEVGNPEAFMIPGGSDA